MKPVAGKTYSLFGNSNTSDEYFETVRKLTDFHLEKFCLQEQGLLELIRVAEKRKEIKNNITTEEPWQAIRYNFSQILSKYTLAVKVHLKTLSFFQRFDSTLRTKAYQYHLYMIKIELVNRIYAELFKNSLYKMALFPHCLRDFRTKCLSKIGDIEYVCQGCTKDCLIHLGSKLLRVRGIQPFISVTRDQRKLLKEVKKQHFSMGVIGIACIPELVRGIRLCQSLDIPAIGIPLDANRCSRWLGRAYETSFNMKELEKLIK